MNIEITAHAQSAIPYCTRGKRVERSWSGRTVMVLPLQGLIALAVPSKHGVGGSIQSHAVRALWASGYTDGMRYNHQDYDQEGFLTKIESNGPLPQPSNGTLALMACLHSANGKYDIVTPTMHSFVTYTNGKWIRNASTVH